MTVVTHRARVITVRMPVQPVSEPSPRETGRSGLLTWAERDANNVTDEMEKA